MDDSRKKILADYTSHLCASGATYNVIGRKIKHVRDFLDSGEEVSRKGYRSYKSHNAGILAEPLAMEGLLELLEFLGIGYRKRGKTDSVKPLEKIGTLSRKNIDQLNKFLVWLAERNDYSRHTIALYRYTMNKFFEYSNEFTQENARRYISTMEKEGRKPSTIRAKINVFEKYGKWTGKTMEFKRPKIKKSLDTDNVPTENEYRKLLKHLLTHSNKDHYFWVKILAATGARISEMLQFKWEDILNGEVTLRGKGNKYRRFFFHKALQEEVSSYVSENGKTGFVCIGKQGLITSRGFASNLNKWGVKAGIDKRKMHPHAFRHFFAKMYLKNSKDVVQLAEFLGHGSVDTTMIYLQKTKEEQMEEINRNVKW